MGKRAENPAQATLLDGHRFSQNQQKTILEILQVNPDISSTTLIEKMKTMGDPLSITDRHLNRVRSFWGLNRSKGRPKGKKEPKKKQT